VVGEHQREHRKHEQVEKCEEAIKSLIAMHVADSKDVDEKPDKSDEEGVGSAEPIHAEREVSAKSSDLQPGPDVIEQWRFGSQCTSRLEGKIKRHDGRDRH